MSATLSTARLVANVIQKIPEQNISVAAAIDRVNQAFRWIEQQGDFTWMVKGTTVAVSTATFPAQNFPLPADCDTSRPMFLSTPIVNTLVSEIPYKPWEEAWNLQTFGTNAVAGVYAGWTNLVAAGYLLPSGAVQNGSTLALVYHRTTPAEKLIDNGTYYPSPDCFDDVIVDFAEAELRRVYGLKAWDVLMKRAEGAAMKFFDKYRSNRKVLSGLAQVQAQASEIQTKRQE